jgi:hypothetical protein
MLIRRSQELLFVFRYLSDLLCNLPVLAGCGAPATDGHPGPVVFALHFAAAWTVNGTSGIARTGERF